MLAGFAHGMIDSLRKFYVKFSLELLNMELKSSVRLWYPILGAYIELLFQYLVLLY